MQWLFCFGLITKLKKGLELAFGEHFLYGSLYKCSLFNTHQLTKFQCHIFYYFSRSQTKCVINSYLVN